MAFPNSNLPANVQPWSRDVQNRVETLERNVKANEINSVSRDVQLDTNYKRIDKIVNDLVVTDGRILIAQAQADQAIIDAAAAAGEAQDAADAAGAAASAAATAAGTANTAATTANTSLNGLIGLGSTGSGYTLNADNINGGTITGITLRTAASGQRVQLSGSRINFYSATSGTNVTGYMDSGNYGVQISTGTPIFYMSSGTVQIKGGTAEVNIGSSTSVTGDLDATGDIGSGGTVSGDDGFYTMSGISSFGGDVRASGIYSQASSQPYNVHIQPAANNYKMFRSTYESSRAIKRDIRELEFDSEAYMSVKPVVFKYNEGILREEEKDWDIIGFIAEDFEDAGFADKLITQPGSEGEVVQLRYDKMYMFLHKVVAEQNQTIKDLTARIETLESKV